MVGTEKSACKL